MYLQVRLISISNGLDTQEENAKVGYQFRSIFNELYLTDLKKKTHRGQIGQAMRGFMMVGISYGYESVPVGELRPDKKGWLKADGYTQKIVPDEKAPLRSPKSRPYEIALAAYRRDVFQEGAAGHPVQIVFLVAVGGRTLYFQQAKVMV